MIGLVGRRWLVGGWLSLLAFLPTVLAAEIELFPEVGMTLRSLDGFVRAERFHGLRNSSAGASVVLTAIPGPYEQVTAGFNSDSLATKGVQLVSRQAITVDGAQGELIELTQLAAGTMYRKWVVLLGDSELTRMVTASFPASAPDALGDQLKNTVLGVELVDIASGGGTLPFAVTAADDLAPLKVGGIGKIAAFTRAGSQYPGGPDDPLFLVAPSLVGVPVANHRQFAQQRLRATAGVEATRVESSSEVVIDGLRGFELVASATGSRSGVPMRVYQVMLFPDSGGYVLMSGLVGEPLAARYIPAFRAMAGSYTSVAAE